MQATKRKQSLARPRVFIVLGTQRASFEGVLSPLNQWAALQAVVSVPSLSSLLHVPNTTEARSVCKQRRLTSPRYLNRSRDPTERRSIERAESSKAPWLALRGETEDRITTGDDLRDPSRKSAYGIRQLGSRHRETRSTEIQPHANGENQRYQGSGPPETFLFHNLLNYLFVSDMRHAQQ